MISVVLNGYKRAEYLDLQIKSIKEQSSSGDSSGNTSPKDEIPPHY
jgi:hypothetical protein